MKLFIVAGDPSGDLHGSILAKKIKELQPSIEIYSAGGENLASATTQILNLTEIAVTGIFEVLSYFNKILKHFKFLVKKIDQIQPQALILIDFPDFNLRLAKIFKPKGLKIFYYISPQVWAWRKKRVNFIKKYVDKMLVIFPFEQDFYKENNIPAAYVGHPLVEKIHRLQLKDQKPQKLIALLPGSREKEVAKHLPCMLKSKKLLGAYNFKFVIIKHPQLRASLFKKAKNQNVEIVERNLYQTLAQSYIAISSSGTATLELALLNIPTIVIYKMGILSWLLLKSMVRVDFISITNIIGKDKIFPELIQYRATARKITAQCKQLIENKKLYAATKEKLKKIKDILGDSPASKIAAEEILTQLKVN